MEKFTFQCQTKLIFGEDSVDKIKDEIQGRYKRVLLHYGGGSIKRTGLYEKVLEELKDSSVEVLELSGVEPNPKLSLVREGVNIVKENNIDLILAVGGGSVIDSAKAIGIGALYKEDVWDFYTGKAKVEKSLPVGVILTIPATGSEASMGSVITNEEGLYKRAVNSDIMRPTFAIMDPKLSLTLPEIQTFAGIMDILSHIFERYFTNTPNVDLIDGLSESTMKNIIKNAYALKENPEDHNARAEIMLAGTLAHNGLLGLGRKDDWASHDISHEMSALYGTTHGVALGIIFPAWMKYVYRENLDRFVRFANKVFHIDMEEKTKEDIALQGIKSFESFLRDMGLPRTFTEAGLPTDEFELMAEKATENGPFGNLKKIYKEDIVKIYNLAK